MDGLPGSASLTWMAPRRAAADVRRLGAAVQAWVAAARRSVDELMAADGAGADASGAAMTRPSLAQAVAWRPEALTELGAEWDAAAGRLQSAADIVDGTLRPNDWTGAAARAAGEAISPAIEELRQMCRALVIAAAEARDAALTIGAGPRPRPGGARRGAASGCPVADDGTVEPPPARRGCCWPAVAVRGDTLPPRCSLRRLQDALSRLGDADREAARAIDAAFGVAPAAAKVRPAGPPTPGWRTGPR